VRNHDVQEKQNAVKLEIGLPDGSRIVAMLSGYVEPGGEDCGWAGVNVDMVSTDGAHYMLCSAEYVEDVRKVRVFGSSGRINELEVGNCADQAMRKNRKTTYRAAGIRLGVA